MTKDQRENFERAFSSGISGCRRTCNCGRVFYDIENDYDWEEGELESLVFDPNATSLEYSVGTIIMDGQEFVCACDCWVDRATSAVAWMDLHAQNLAFFLTLEKQRKTDDAERSPVVGAVLSAAEIARDNARNDAEVFRACAEKTFGPMPFPRKFTWETP